jgi:hypothetical protein
MVSYLTLASVAGNAALAMAWVHDSVVSHLAPGAGGTLVAGIVAGNEVVCGGGGGDPDADPDPELARLVLPAMRSLHAALREFGLERRVFVSTAHSFAVLGESFPPSAGAFRPAIAQAYMRPVLGFLASTAAPFLVNVYPFLAFKASASGSGSGISLDYALFRANPGIVDPGSGLRYLSLFDAQLDAVHSAIAGLGFPNVSVVVSETGWPSAGDADEAGAGLANAQAYHANLALRVASLRGTPLRPSAPLRVYLFALFNEDRKPGPASERHYGLFNPDCTPAYDFHFLAPRSATPALAAATSASTDTAPVSSSSPPPLLPSCILGPSLLVYVFACDILPLLLLPLYFFF